MNWLPTTPTKLHRVSHIRSLFGINQSGRKLRWISAKTIAAPISRHNIRFVVDIERRAIFPKIGQVPNSICTPMSARCGAIAETRETEGRFTVLEVRTFSRRSAPIGSEKNGTKEQPCGPGDFVTL